METRTANLNKILETYTANSNKIIETHRQEIVIVNMIATHNKTEKMDYTKFLQIKSNNRNNLDHYSKLTTEMADKLGISVFTLWKDEEWQQAVHDDWCMGQSALDSPTSEQSASPSSSHFKLESEIIFKNNAPDRNLTKRYINGKVVSEMEHVNLNMNRAFANLALAEVKQRLPYVTMSIFADPPINPVGTAVVVGKSPMAVQDKALVDTGSMFSMLKKTYTYLLGTGPDKFHNTSLSRYRFLAANGTPITIYGSVSIIVALCPNKKIRHIHTTFLLRTFRTTLWVTTFCKEIH